MTKTRQRKKATELRMAKRKFMRWMAEFSLTFSLSKTMAE